MERRHPERGIRHRGVRGDPVPQVPVPGVPGKRGALRGGRCGTGPRSGGSGAGSHSSPPAGPRLPVPSVSVHGAEGRHGGQGRLAGAPQPPPEGGCLRPVTPGWEQKRPGRTNFLSASRSRDHTQGPGQTSLARGGPGRTTGLEPRQDRGHPGPGMRGSARPGRGFSKERETIPVRAGSQGSCCCPQTQQAR